jgi:hypothetical protein
MALSGHANHLCGYRQFLPYVTVPLLELLCNLKFMQVRIDSTPTYLPYLIRYEYILFFMSVYTFKMLLLSVLISYETKYN